SPFPISTNPNVLTIGNLYSRTVDSTPPPVLACPVGAPVRAPNWTQQAQPTGGGGIPWVSLGLSYPPRTSQEESFSPSCSWQLPLEVPLRKANHKGLRPSPQFPAIRTSTAWGQMAFALVTSWSDSRRRRARKCLTSSTLTSARRSSAR